MLLPWENYPSNPFNPCSLKKVFALPTEFFSNTDYKDFHRYYCLAVCNSCLRRVIRWIRYIRVRLKSVRFTSRVLFEHGLYGFSRMLLLWENYPSNPFNPCSKHSPVNVKKNRQKKYQPCFVPFLTVISTFSALFSKKYFLLNVIPPFHLTPVITLIISSLYMVELGWK